jgi:hypothetical protein
MKRDKLRMIRRKVNDIGYGLLRLRDEEKSASLYVNALYEEGSLLKCFADKRSDTQVFQNKVVSLVQKQNDDYLYIAGQVDEVFPANGGKIVSIRVFKASWFVRKSKGTLSWLQEKQVVEFGSGEELQMVS